MKYRVMVTLIDFLTHAVILGVFSNRRFALA